VLAPGMLSTTDTAQTPLPHVVPVSAQSCRAPTNPVPFALHVVAMLPSQAGCPGVHTSGSQIAVAGLQSSVVVQVTTTLSLKPSALHWRTTAPSQRRVPGEQPPVMHAPAEQTRAESAQFVELSTRSPSAEHTTLTLPVHSVCPAEQTQFSQAAPAAPSTHVERAGHGEGAKKAFPSDEQRTIALFRQRLLPGAQTSRAHTPSAQNSLVAQSVLATHSTQ
jgi:hypothetical protein